MLLEALDYQGLQQTPHHHRAAVVPAFLVTAVQLVDDLLDVAPRPLHHGERQDELIRRTVSFDGGTKLFGASDLRFLTRSMALLNVSTAMGRLGTFVDVLRHALEDFVDLVWRGVGGNMNL